MTNFPLRRDDEGLESRRGYNFFSSNNSVRSSIARDPPNQTTNLVMHLFLSGRYFLGRK